MAKVRIRNEDIEFEVPDGQMLKEYAKKHSSLMFGCEKGDCGMCVCSVSKGRENVNIKTYKEEQTLNKIGAHEAARLACQIKIKKGEVEIEY